MNNVCNIGNNVRSALCDGRDVAVFTKNDIANALFFWRYLHIYFVLARQYSAFQAAKLISRSADSADCTSIVTYIDIPARTRPAYVFTHSAKRGTWSHIITFIKGLSYMSNENARVHSACVCVCAHVCVCVFVYMCCFFDETLDCSYLLFRFRENWWKIRLSEKSYRHAWCDNI